MSKASPSTVCIVNCHPQPDYVRAVTLADGLKNSKMFDKVIVVRNKSSGIKRYVEVYSQLLRVRFAQNPAVYFVTFRPYEILPFVLFLGIGKKVVYDEMINPVEWFVYEHKKFSMQSWKGRLLKSAFRYFGNRSTAILADTQSHAKYSAKLMDLPFDKYMHIPVSTDESMFHPEKHSRSKDDPFKVLYCGNMLPLYGVDHVLQTAVELAGNSNIEFHFVGGKQAVADKVAIAKQKGARINYQSWVPYKDFPALFHSSDLCLGGPFGKTVQSRYVITGKTYQFLAAELPVVIGDNQESHQFRNKHNALIVPEANAEELRKVIEWASTHPKELASIAKNGRKLYEEKFSSKRVADDLRLLAKERLFDV